VFYAGDGGLATTSADVLTAADYAASFDEL